MTWLAVMLGAAVGAPARFLLDRWITERTASAGAAGEFPWGLFVVNTLGSAIAGIVLAAATGSLRVLLLSGFCGGFTTFSGFGWEADRLWNTARGVFWAAVLGMTVACVLSFMLAWQVTGLLVG